MVLSAASGSGVRRAGGTSRPAGAGGAGRSGRGRLERDRRAPAPPRRCRRGAGGGGRLVVLGRAAERAVALSDLTDEGAQAEVVRRLRRLGVDRALARAGCPRRGRGHGGRHDLHVGRGAVIAVVKVGSSSVTPGTVRRLCGELAAARADGHTVVVVTSGAIAAGWDALDRGRQRPSDPAVLQAVSAVGQHRLMRLWQDGFEPHGLLAGQVLLAPLDFVHRTQYLHAAGDAAPPGGPRRGPGGQRERRRGRRGDPLRRQRPPGRPGRPPGRSRSSSSCSPTRPACSRPTPGAMPRPP